MSPLDVESLLLDELRAIRTEVAGLRQSIAATREDLVGVKVALRLKGGVWGAIGGAIPTIAGVLIWIVSSH